MRILKVQKTVPIASFTMAGVAVHHYHHSPKLALTTIIIFGVTDTLITALMCCTNHCFKWKQVRGPLHSLEHQDRSLTKLETKTPSRSSPQSWPQEPHPLTSRQRFKDATSGEREWGGDCSSWCKTAWLSRWRCDQLFWQSCLAMSVKHFVLHSLTSSHREWEQESQAYLFCLPHSTWHSDAHKVTRSEIHWIREWNPARHLGGICLHMKCD